MLLDYLFMKELNRKDLFGFDPDGCLECIGRATIEHKDRVSQFEFYYSLASNKIDVCYFGCNGTYLSGMLLDDETTLPSEFNEPFMKLKEWYFSLEKKELDRQKAITKEENLNILERAIEADAREFAVKSSAHGSSFRFDGRDPDNPTLPPLTLGEAVKNCYDWVGIADTVGGRAVIYHIPTKMTFGYKSIIGFK